MIKFKNFIGSNPNITVLEEEGNYKVLQYDEDLSVYPSEAQTKYFMSQMGATQKQLLITLRGDSVKLAAGAMQMMLGDIQMTTGVKGITDMVGKAFRAKATGDSAIKPVYTGKGYVLTEPTYRFLIIEDLREWQGALTCDDGMFLACSTDIKDTVQMRSNLSSAVAGGEGLFNLALIGEGLVVLQSRHPRTELIELELQNDTVKIDGNMAVCWSSGLEFTVERSGKTLIGSAASGEGLVNVYRGTGKILMCPV